MKNYKSREGFTLIELLVAVALMLVLVGAIVAIFNQSSEIFNTSEAKMNLFQNTRVALDMMSRELAAARNDDPAGVKLFTITNPTDGTSPVDILKFRTITSWENLAGLADVTYRLERQAENRWNLIRVIEEVPPQTPPRNFQGLMAQFINAKDNNAKPNLTIEFFTFDANTKRWSVGTFDSGGNSRTFPAGKLPEAIRITMDLQDKQKRAVRTVSRTFWIANGNFSD